MNKRILSCAVVTAFTLGILHAGEFRAPATTQNGPLRYDVYKKSDKWSFNMWSIGSYRSASRSFLKHGLKTKEFTALLFGSEDFKVGQAFSPDDAAAFTENFNMNLNATHLTPRAVYSEQGMTVGGRFEYPLCDNTARIGVKASVPFKTIRVERDDTAETAAAGDQTNVVHNISVDVKVPDATGKPKDVKVTTNMYRLSFVKDLPFLNDGKLTHYVSQGLPASVDEDNMTIGGKGYDQAISKVDGYNVTNHSIPFVLISNTNAKQIPFVEDFAVGMEPKITIGGTSHVLSDGIAQVGNNVAVTDIVIPGFLIKNLTEAPTDLALSENTLHAFTNGNGKAYQATLNDSSADLDNIWLLAVNKPDGSMLQPDVIGGLEGKIERYGKDSAEQWLYQNGYQFLTTQRMGLGDADVDLFYEHNFNADWRGQAILGLRLPTGGNNDYANNAYETRCLLGNGNHFEIKLGANIGWATPLDWLNLHADASYSFALSGKEKRAAAFAGATVHGIGPQVEADVDWGYFVTRLDATMFHPKTDDLSSTWGYEFYYKTKDNVKFKQATVTNDSNDSWFGGKWSDEEGKFVSWEQTLDNKVAAQNTERIAHRLRFESHWQAHKYMSLFVGGAFTFAGQNVSRDADAHFGMNVRF